MSNSLIGRRNDAMNIEFLNPPDLCPTFGWTHVVASRGGKTIHVSGQVGIYAAGKVVAGDLKGQTEQAFKNTRTALAAAGATSPTW
jgi:enamine deaminase RidA (YjgF/YER057c/UK114 family)